MPNKFFQRIDSRIRTDHRSLVWLSLLLELLLLSYSAFLGLFTLEMLLPGFISTKINLVKFLSFLVLFTLVALGWVRLLKLEFPAGLPYGQLPFWITGAWFTGVLLLAFLKFPFWTMPVLVITTLAIAVLFFRLFSQDSDER